MTESFAILLYLEGLGYDEMMIIRLLQLNDVEMNDKADVKIQRNFFNVETYLQNL